MTYIIYMWFIGGEIRWGTGMMDEEGQTKLGMLERTTRLKEEKERKRERRS